MIDGRVIELRPGEAQSIRITTRGVRDRLVVVLHAGIPAGVRQGTAFTVGVTPSIGRRALVGWATRFRVADRRDMMVQIHDDAAAGLGDLAEMADTPGVHALYCTIGRDFCERAYSIAELASRVAALRHHIDQAATELRRITEARRIGAADSARRLLQILDEYDAGFARADDVVAAYRALCNRAKMAAALLSES